MRHSRGGLTTKIHALVDAEGRPIRLMLTPGQAGDAPVALAMTADLASGSTLIADRAYDTDAIRDLAAARGDWPTSRPKQAEKAPSASAAGFIASAILSSGSLTGSSSSEASRPDTTGSRKTTSPHSSSTQRKSGSTRNEPAL